MTCRSLTEHTLSGLGVEIQSVKNGQEAVEAFANGRFDLVLMDCHMPTLDGFGAALLIREIETRERRTPIVALTGTAVGVELERCREVGMDGHLDKLSGPQELRQALAEWIARVAPEEAAPGANAGAGMGAGMGNRVVVAPIVVHGGAAEITSAPAAAGHHAGLAGHTSHTGQAAQTAQTTHGAALGTSAHGSPAQDAACLDVSVLEDLRAFSSPDDDLLAELRVSFEANVADQLPKLQAAARASDADAVRFIAHRLRGTCGNLGARRMQFLCERLESLGREGVTAGASELIDDLSREFVQARAAIDAWMRPAQS